MISTTTTISDVLEGLPFATPTADVSGQWSGVKTGSVIAQNADADHFLVGQVIAFTSLEDLNSSIGTGQDVSNQALTNFRSATIFALANDTNLFAPWTLNTQALTDTTIGNTIQVVQGTMYRQVWG